MVFNLLIGQHLFSHPQLCRCVRNDATFPMFSCDWEFWGSCASVSWLLRKGRGLLGKAEMVQQVHLTPQSYWMIYSVNGFNYGRAHTHTHAKRLNGFLSSAIQIQSHTELLSKTNDLYNCCSLSHTPHKQINSRLCFVTPRFILTPTGTHAHVQTYVHMGVCPHTAERLQDSFKYANR